MAIFFHSSKTVLSRVVMKHTSIPVGHSSRMKECAETANLILNKVLYLDHK